MAANRTPPAEAVPKPDAAKEPAAKAASEAPAPSGGLKAWLPLVITLVLMPVLAYLTTTFVLLPKLRPSKPPTGEVATASAGNEHEGGNSEGAGSAHGGAKPPGGGKVKQNVALTKLIVNVAGTMGTRYLMTSVTLVGSTSDFKTKIEENRDQLLDLANSTLRSKTITDLERPGAVNQIRTELLTVFNGALGENLIQEIFFTELAIQ